MKEVEPDLTEAEYIKLFLRIGVKKDLKSGCLKKIQFMRMYLTTRLHTCSYDQNTSINLRTTQNHSVNLGLGLGGGGSGVNVGGSFGYGYNRSTTRGNFSDLGESKQSSVEFQIKFNQAVVVKEVTYR